MIREKIMFYFLRKAEKVYKVYDTDSQLKAIKYMRIASYFCKDPVLKYEILEEWHTMLMKVKEYFSELENHVEKLKEVK